VDSPFIAAIFSKYDESPIWWQNFLSKNEKLIEDMPNREFGSKMNEFLKDKNARIYTAYDMDIDDSGSPWVITFDTAEDFLAFKLQWC